SVSGVAFSPDGMTLASVGNDQSLRIWNLKTGKEHHAIKRESYDQVDGLAFSPDGKAVAMTCSNLTVRLWDAQTGKAGKVFVGYDGFGQNGGGFVRFSPDGKTLLSPVCQGSGGGRQPLFPDGRRVPRMPGPRAVEANPGKDPFDHD